MRQSISYLVTTGCLRGQNKWAKVEALVVAGRMMPKAADVERIAGGLFFDQPEAVNSGIIGDATGTYRMRNGDRIDARVEMHSLHRWSSWSANRL